ncbi:hypothetical protein P7C73_g726, partial [Tremellales sp. Uapishka_1]
MAHIIDSPPGSAHAGYIENYGPTYQIPAYFGTARLFSSDAVALSYVLGHPDIFSKPEDLRYAMERRFGKGVLAAEGEDHRRQRKVLNPSFSPAALRNTTGVFYDKAEELKDVLNCKLQDASAKDETRARGTTVDMLLYLGRTSLDIIGIAGFGYDFQSLSMQDNELAGAYRDMFQSHRRTVWGVLQQVIPFLRIFPSSDSAVIRNSTEVANRIGQQLVDDKKKDILAVSSASVGKGQDFGQDLLSNLIRANMASDLRPEQRISEKEVLAQITTFMLAGNETSSTAMTWILYCLAQNPESQKRLRTELRAVQDDRPSSETLASLPYLDAVVREVLRLLPPVPSTVRSAAEDAIIPLGTPVSGRDGTLIENVKVGKGTLIYIPIINVNTSTAIWGEDAGEYIPDRFERSHAAADKVPGTWGNLLTFMGGTRNCIGYRFALIELKAILFVLIRNFAFEELPNKPEIVKKSLIVMRPRVVGQEKMGSQLPLLVKAVAG